jgi:hypothetical protein
MRAWTAQAGPVTKVPRLREPVFRRQQLKEEGCVGSVLKWRRKKINKHKYRLLRKKLRHRRRAGR